MKIQILQISKTKEPAIQALEHYYEKLLRPYFELESVDLPASKFDDAERALLEEKAVFEKKLDPKAFRIALSPQGKLFDSPAFAQKLEKIRDFHEGRLQFLIGGSCGLHPALLAQCQESWSLSPLTMTHELIRPVLKEQLYRAGTILAGKRYHK